MTFTRGCELTLVVALLGILLLVTTGLLEGRFVHFLHEVYRTAFTRIGTSAAGTSFNTRKQKEKGEKEIDDSADILLDSTQHL